MIFSNFSLFQAEIDVELSPHSDFGEVLPETDPDIDFQKKLKNGVPLKSSPHEKKFFFTFYCLDGIS